jgi:GAF domain-containing protein/anti-sigma regulatory factor (Ser/Thr protein kinase)
MLILGAEPDSVPYARRYVAASIRGTAAEPLLADAELVVSELVTNALLHGGAPATLRVLIDGDVVRIEVGDGSRRAPLRALARADAMTGRGLSLVAALAREWGVEPRVNGKVVWCEMSVSSAATEEVEEVDVDALLAAWDDDEPEGDRRYTVVLGDVPTDLLLGAKAHVDNLVREFTLAAAGAASGRGAAIPVHLATLIDDVVNGFAEARQSIKRQAIDAATRGDRRTSLSLSLPLSAADAGERYLAALDEADTYARAARLLTLETPPQHQVFRRWYVESLVGQLRAMAVGDEPDPPVTFERRLLDELRVVAAARRASDQAARLQAVTAALAAATDATAVGQVVLSEAVAALGASGGGLLVLAGGHVDVTASVGYDATTVERLRNETPDEPLPAVVALRTGEPVWIESRQERDTHFPDLVAIEPSTVALCAVPLVVEGRTLGALRFSFDQPRLFDFDERRFVLTLAGQTAQALGRANAMADLAAANDKLAFLAEASAELSRSLDYRTTLTNVARLAVPRLADWCTVHLADEEGIRVITVAHVDPEKVALAEAFASRYPVDPDAPTGVAAVIRTGNAEIVPEIEPAMFERIARDEEHLAAIVALGLRSALIVPLATRDRVLGTLSMFHAESGRSYGATDLALAEDLAKRGAMAIEHATLFRDLAQE